MPVLLPGSRPTPVGPTDAPAHWDAPGLRWDRSDLRWDLPLTWLVLPYRSYGLADPVAVTTWLDVDFDTIVTYSNLHKDPSMAVLSVPFTFATAGLQTPTARLDANFAAVRNWCGTWPGESPPHLPYLFSPAGPNTPLFRLDANFLAIADWWNL